MAGITATYISPSAFTVATNRTDEFCADRRVKADCDTDGFKFGTITSSSYSNPDTTVNLTVASDDLTSNLIDVYYGLVSEGSSGSVPVHNHDGSEGSGDIVVGAAHTVASHSDTTATGAELETLTDNSIANTLHRHSELVASDGSPDPALSIDANGKASFPTGTGINEFSTDTTLAGNSDDAVSTEKAIKTYIDAKLRSYVKVSDVKSSGTAGGTFTKDVWQTRTLNTKDSDTNNFCTLSTNQITLSAGTYECRISAPARLVDRHKIKLRNITGSTDLIIGTSEETYSSNIVTTRAFLIGKFTIAASQALEVQHRCSTTKVTNGFGYACSFSVNEVYTVAEFWKVE